MGIGDRHGIRPILEDTPPQQARKEPSNLIEAVGQLREDIAQLNGTLHVFEKQVRERLLELEKAVGIVQ